MLTLSINPNGTLELKANAELRDELRDCGDYIERLLKIVDALEAYSCNGSFAFIPAENVGALTDSPIIAESVEYDDDGTPQAVGRLWWFPDYAVIDETQALMDYGITTFSGAPL